MATGLGVLAVRASGRRAAPWALALPLPARTLWSAHVRALALAVSLVMVVIGTVIGLLSRLLAHLMPEEIGFGGAQLLAEGGRLPRSARVVSLEASMALAGAQPGRGPVILGAAAIQTQEVRETANAAKDAG